MPKTYVGEGGGEIPTVRNRLRGPQNRAIQMEEDANLMQSSMKMSSPVLSALHEMGVGLDELIEAVNILNNRLSPIFADYPVKAAGPSDSPEMGPSKGASPLLADLERKTAQISDVKTGIITIIERLQI